MSRNQEPDDQYKIIRDLTTRMEALERLVNSVFVSGGISLDSTNSIYIGAGAPAASLGADGDYYLRKDGGASTHVYFKSSGSWSGIV